MWSGVFLFFYPCGFIFFTRQFFESCFLFFLWKSNFLSPFDALQKRSFSAYFHFYLSILSFFVVSSLRRFHWWYHTMSDYCTVDFGIFFIIFRLLFFRFVFFSGRYLYDSSDYHSSYLLILITHLPFLWEMRCSHHDSTRSRNHENVAKLILASLLTVFYTDTHYWHIGLRSTHIIFQLVNS